MAKVNFLHGTETNYNGLSTKDSNTLYLLTDTKKIYKGDTLIATGSITETITNQKDLTNAKNMNGTYTLSDGYCFLSVSTELVSGASSVAYELPVEATALASTVAADSGAKYYITTGTQSNKSVMLISKLTSGTCADETINFTLVYKYV